MVDFARPAEVTLYYHDVERLVSINARFGGGVIDLPGLEAAAYRPQSGFGDVDTFPSVWDKAAAYLHGLAATQYFADGNKRTAWTAATSFLALNGYRLPRVPDVEAETLVHAVALQVFNADDEPDKTVQIASEWFQSKWDNQRPGPALDPRLEYAALASHCENASGEGTFNIQGYGMHTCNVERLPGNLPVWAIGRLHWDDVDPMIPHQIEVQYRSDEGSTAARQLTPAVKTLATVGPPSGHSHHLTGRIPTLFAVDAYVQVSKPCMGAARILLDGDVILYSLCPFRHRMSMNQ